MFCIKVLDSMNKQRRCAVKRPRTSARNKVFKIELRRGRSLHVGKRRFNYARACWGKTVAYMAMKVFSQRDRESKVNLLQTRWHGVNEPK